MGRRHRKPREKRGLRIEVRNNNVEFALKKMKRMVKDSGMMVDLRRRTHYEKPSEVKREKRNLAKLRNKYNNQKEKNLY
jgi:small subunit ribosomal protein S21